MKKNNFTSTQHEMCLTCVKTGVYGQWTPLSVHVGIRYVISARIGEHNKDHIMQSITQNSVTFFKILVRVVTFEVHLVNLM